jgi:hypothetical protein
MEAHSAISQVAYTARMYTNLGPPDQRLIASSTIDGPYQQMTRAGETARTSVLLARHKPQNTNISIALSSLVHTPPIYFSNTLRGCFLIILNLKSLLIHILSFLRGRHLAAGCLIAYTTPRYRSSYGPERNIAVSPPIREPHTHLY